MRTGSNDASHSPGMASAFAVLLLLCTAVVWAGSDVPSLVHGMADLASGPTPWWIAEHAAVLYLWTPIVALCGLTLVFLPGLLLALGMFGGRLGFGGWLVQGVALTLLILPVAAGFGLAAGVAVVGPVFAYLLVALTVPGLVLVQKRSRAIDWSIFANRGRDIVAMYLVPVAVLFMLSPKFFWEAFNGDGAHLFESTRWFIRNGLPFWPGAAGGIGTYPTANTLTEVLVGSFTVRLFGETPFALRLAYLPGLAILTGLILDLVRKAPSEPTPLARLASVAAAIGLYAWIMSWHSSYDPYFADIALPALREPWVLVAFLGFVLAYSAGSLGWTAAGVVLTYISIPSAPVLIGLWLLGDLAVSRPRPFGRAAGCFAMLIAVMVAGKLVPAGLAALGLAGNLDEFSSENIAQRLRYVTVFEFGRLAWIALPAGILPALSVFAWKWQDDLSRKLSLVAIGYGAFFFVQGYRVLPHHFAPVMLIPLIVFWRLPVTRIRPWATAVAVLAGLLISAVVSQPRDYRPHLYGREFAHRILVEASGYAEVAPAEMAAFHDLFLAAFPPMHGENAAASRYLGSPLAWYAMASEPKAMGQEVTYIVRTADAGVQPAETVLAETPGWILVTADPAQVEADRAHGMPSAIGTFWFVRRGAAFGRGQRGFPHPVLDLVWLVKPQ